MPTGRGECLSSAGDVEENPGPGAGDDQDSFMDCMISWESKIHLHRQFSPSYDAVSAMGGPCGGYQSHSTFQEFYCCYCGKRWYILADLSPLEVHIARCTKTHRKTGRGEDLLSHGDVEANPGPKVNHNPRHLSSDMDTDGDSRPFYGPEDNNTPLEWLGFVPIFSRKTPRQGCRIC